MITNIKSLIPAQQLHTAVKCVCTLSTGHVAFWSETFFFLRAQVGPISPASDSCETTSCCNTTTPSYNVTWPSVSTLKLWEARGHCSSPHRPFWLLLFLLHRLPKHRSTHLINPQHMHVCVRMCLHSQVKPLHQHQSTSASGNVPL